MCAPSANPPFERYPPGRPYERNRRWLKKDAPRNVQAIDGNAALERNARMPVVLNWGIIELVAEVLVETDQPPATVFGLKPEVVVRLVE